MPSAPVLSIEVFLSCDLKGDKGWHNEQFAQLLLVKAGHLFSGGKKVQSRFSVTAMVD